SGTIGANNGWVVSPNAFTVGPHRFDRAGAVTVGGVLYPTSHPSKSLAIDNGNDFSTVEMMLPGGHRVLTIAGYITFGPPQVPQSLSKLWDYVGIWGKVTGGYAVLQLNNGLGGIYALNVESSDGGTHHSAKIIITPGATYWCVLRADYVSGTARLNVYDATQLTLVGSVTTTMIKAEDINKVSFGNGENGVAAGVTSYFENMVLDYQGVFPLGPDGDPHSSVSLGSSAATNVNVLSSSTLTALSPAHPTGSVAVTVTNPDGQSGSVPDGFTYVQAPAPTLLNVAPTSGSATGGTTLTLTGADFAPGATVTVGGLAATAVSVVSATAITALTPPHAVGAVDVTVMNADGQSATLPNSFSYLPSPGPTLTSVAPTTGPIAGGTVLTLTGTNFAPRATVTLGG